MSSHEIFEEAYRWFCEVSRRRRHMTFEDVERSRERNEGLAYEDIWERHLDRAEEAEEEAELEDDDEEATKTPPV